MAGPISSAINAIKERRRTGHARCRKAMAALHRHKRLYHYSWDLITAVDPELVHARVKYHHSADWHTVIVPLDATIAEMKNAIMVMEKFAKCL